MSSHQAPQYMMVCISVLRDHALQSNKGENRRDKGKSPQISAPGSVSVSESQVAGRLSQPMLISTCTTGTLGFQLRPAAALGSTAFHLRQLLCEHLSSAQLPFAMMWHPWSWAIQAPSRHGNYANSAAEGLWYWGLSCKNSSPSFP